MPQIDALRSRLIENGASFTVVKNTLTRRAAEAAGADALLALLEGPSAIAFIEADGDMVAVAKALADSAPRDEGARDPRRRHAGPRDDRRTRSRASRSSRRSTCCAARCSARSSRRSPRSLGLVNAPLQNLYGLIDARIEQLGRRSSAAPRSPAGRGSRCRGSRAAEEPAAEARPTSRPRNEARQRPERPHRKNDTEDQEE